MHCAMEKTCPFCDPPEMDVILRNDLCYARFDRYPVSNGHLLVIPFRHVADFFELTEAELEAAFQLVREAKKKLDGEYRPDGFNVGVNVGSAAGQTVMHVHVHLIPRYRGDMERPEGGVRGVIPEKQVYRT
jgi:diadenosine tetraphosphate (Ap4A) HIT family hydrolase